ncbi:5-oxoprolinase subunit PxpA [uncultured Lacinutrix sp.]|uniref:5-oxoprolinase subunit PxpA n=1 Tax=uncultured Lacinutrix sp. TaxID=574032 RepID=UPI002614B71D|nr:5-oxoprolinase subunit PxpA [uncultured Lacinutrix sp.]
MQTIDINCDVGEGFNNEDKLMPYLSSCNIACTGHAGTIQTIDETIAIAKQNNVKIGAHPSFPDTENFGRKYVEMSSKELQESLEFQINLLVERAALQNVKLNHVKVHGALYNLSTVDEDIANIIIQAMQNTVGNILLYVPYNSVIETIAKQNGIPIKREAFIDRNYNEDLTLVSRNLSNAIISKPEKAFNHLYRMIDEGRVNTVLNRNVRIEADTFCIHGDNEKAEYILKYVSRALKNKGIKIA